MKPDLKMKIKFIAFVASLIVSFIVYTVIFFRNPEVASMDLFLQLNLVPLIFVLAIIIFYFKKTKQVFLLGFWIFPLILIYIHMAHHIYIGTYDHGWGSLDLVFLPIFVYFYMGIFAIIYIIKVIKYLIRKRS